MYISDFIQKIILIEGTLKKKTKKKKTEEENSQNFLVIFEITAQKQEYSMFTEY